MAAVLPLGAFDALVTITLVCWKRDRFARNFPLIVQADVLVQYARYLSVGLAQS
jgi:hypothetical protein